MPMGTGAGDWVLVIAAIGHAALAALSLARGGRSPLARRLSLLCLDLFGWCFATLAHHLTGGAPWAWIDATLTALSPPLVLDVVVAFVGGRSALAPLVRAGYAAFGALALASATAFVGPWGRAFIESHTWGMLLVAGWSPTLAIVLALLVRHLVRARDPDEKARTRTMLAAIALGGALATTDLLEAAGVPLPALGALGTFVGALLVAVAVFRLRLFDRDLSVSAATYVAGIALAGLAAYAVAFSVLGGNVAALTLGAAAITVVLVAASRELGAARALERERIARLATLGRVAAQMAHDLKNPLAALLGASEVLDGEVPAAQQADLLALVGEQARRIRAIVDKYDRLGRIEPVRLPVQMNELVARVAAALRASWRGVDLRTQLAEGLPECPMDADLVAGVVENLLRNAAEAMPGGGTITVRTRVEGGSIVTSVIDTGEGMDARRVDRAFDEFFTTKPTGSGLGLAFARRVALAHGGSVSIASEPKKGTVVDLRLPLHTV
jgi:signal transduction histidine kinase